MAASFDYLKRTRRARQKGNGIGRGADKTLWPAHQKIVSIQTMTPVRARLLYNLGAQHLAEGGAAR